MNKVYKVIWSKARNNYVVVSELAKSHSRSTVTLGRSKAVAVLCAALMCAGGGLVWADGIASTVEGQGSAVKTSTQFQGATASIYGAMNEIDATADKKPYDGVANSIVGAVNVTKNANAALIFGAGNVITNSYGELVDKDGKAVDPAELQTKLQAAYASEGYAGIAKVLGNYVTKSGGSVLAIGGGNTADWAKASAMIGIGNRITGKSGAESKGNFLAGQSNTVTDSEDARVIGKENTVTNSDRQTVIGDSNTIENRDAGTVSGYSGIVRNGVSDLVLGTGNKISGNDTYMTGKESLTVIGNNNDFVNPNSSIVIGDSQKLGGAKESVVIGSMSPEEKADDTTEQKGGSVVVGYHAQSGVKDSGGQNVAVGHSAKALGTMGTVVGVQSVTETGGAGSSTSLLSSVYGAVNKVGVDTDNSRDGIANSIVGTVNQTKNAQNSLIFGSGNVITHAEGEKAQEFEDIIGDMRLFSLEYSAQRNGYFDGAAELMGNYAATNGGSMMVMGNGNTTDYARRSQIMGTWNELKGEKGKESTYNTLAGYRNAATNVSNMSVVGTGNIVSHETSDVVIGDYHKLAGGKNNVILGSMKAEEKDVTREVAIGGAAGQKISYTVKEMTPLKKHTANISNAVMLGYNTDVTKDGGVALGSESVASTDKGVYGYNPLTGANLASEADIAKFSGKEAELTKIGNDLPALTSSYTTAKADYDSKLSDYVAKSSAYQSAYQEYNSFNHDTEDPVAGARRKKAMDDAKVAMDDAKRAMESSKTAYTEAESKYTTAVNTKNKILGTWQSRAAAVSVGDASTGLTRQITGVAAGTEDTDAVNVAQLKASQTHFYSVNSKDSTKGNYNNNGATGTDALAAGVGAEAMADKSVAIGTNAKTQDSNGKKGSGDVAIGNGAHTNNYADQGGSIAVGQNAFAENMAGRQEASFAFGQTTYSGSTWSAARIPQDPTKVPGALVIGENTYARTGGLMVGTHNYKGKLGDVEVDSAHTDKNAKNVFTTTLGTNSFNSGAFSTITGAYSIASGNYEGGRNTTDAAKNFGATITGSLNSIESATDGYSTYSGVANSIVGTANRTANSNGSLVFGAGNEVTNSITDISAPTDGGNSAKDLQDALKDAVRDSESGGATLAIGGGNKADYTQKTSIIGVNNTVTGTESGISKYNAVTGFKNMISNANHVSVIGTSNTIAAGESDVVIGDYHELKGTSNNNVILGSMKPVEKKEKVTVTDYLLGFPVITHEEEVTVLQPKAHTENISNAVMLGYNTDVTKNGGVALGSESVASTDKGVAGYNPVTKAVSADGSDTWTSTAAAVSVGDTSKQITRQITNVAAGTEDTDAVNVAQLKAFDTKVANGAVHYYSAKSSKNGAGSNYANDGATADDSMVIGISSSSDGVNSTVLGNNNKLTGVKNGRNNSIVVGQNLEVDGVHNAVFGTDYNNSDNKLTKVLGEQNTVLGVGNLVGYTAEKDPSNLTKWNYTKVGERGSDQNVVVGLTNTANGGSVVVGTSSVSDSLGVSLGHGNTIIGMDDNGGQRGVALGNNLTVKGEEAVAVGTKAEANADWTIAMGSKAKAEKETAMAFGYESHAKVYHGVALGAWSMADTEAGVAGYDPSTKEASTETGNAWKSVLGAVSVGDKTKGYTRQITNVAAGSEDTDAVNVAQLKKAAEAATDGAVTKGFALSDDAGTKVSQSLGEDIQLKGENGIVTTADVANHKVTISMGDNVQVGKKGETGTPGKDGKVSVNGADGSAVVINGKDGSVGLNGKDGKNGIAIKGADGKPGLNGADGTTETRMIYETKDGTTAVKHEVATLDDGMKFGGDSGAVISKNLNTQMDIKGGATGALSDNNIGVVSDGSQLNVKLAKAVKGLDTVTAGTATMGKGTDGKSYVTGLDNKDWNPDAITSGRAATEDQLKQAVASATSGAVTKGFALTDGTTEVKQELGKAIKLEGENGITVTSDVANKSMKIGLGSDLVVNGKDGKAGKISVNGVDGKSSIGIDGKDGISVKGDKGEVGINGNDGISIKGEAGKDGSIGLSGKDGISLYGKDGKDSKNASVTISGKDGVDGVNGAEGHIGLNGKDGVTDIWTKPGTSGIDGKDGETMTRVVYKDPKGTDHEVATLDDGMKFGGDSGAVISKKLNTQMDIKGGAAGELSENNIGVVSDGSQLNVKLAKDVKGLSTVETKELTTEKISIKEGPTIIKEGMDANNTQIHNVKDGNKPGDAVNYGQLSKVEGKVINNTNTINNLNGKVDRLGTRVNRVGAGAAALAALHPLDFDSDDKWDFAAGYGNYRGANAASVGAFYRPNEDTMFSIGGSFGGGENMVNAGVSIKLGQGNHVSTSRVAMAKEIKALNEKVAMLESALAKTNPSTLADGGKSVLFPDVSENHWAYEYVTKLAKEGIVEGYPDGTFGGDHMMTRYEFATMVYRIMQSGRVGQSKDMDHLVKEFTPELQYIRIDAVSKHKDGTPDIERIRVIQTTK